MEPHAAPVRQRRRGRPLPGGRAVVGGFLVAASVVGLVGVEAAVTGTPSTRYVIVAASALLPAGHVLVANDVRMRAIDLPPSVAAQSHRDSAAVVGRVLVANAAPGELLQRSSLAPRGPRPGELEVSFTVEPTRSLGSRIETGDVVDVFLTTGEGLQASTSLVLRDARIVDRQGRSGSAAYTYTVGLPSEAAAQTLLTAIAAGVLSLVRSTSAAHSGASVVATALRP